MRQFTQVIAQAGRLTSQPVRNGSYVSHIKNATMNEMPVPSGSWAESNSAKQRTYNLHLIAGLAVTIATILVGVKTDAFYLNLGPELKNKK
ncbi:hypothetical protein DAPPUDRAFT_303681 [Daphnia pulex]|uniref:Deltamethrin resistance protein prag01 domain-containing protein n=1 Tax=Daphnia pulex TaxID=6669 RepID=E9GHT9_DAPPU|nr:hypothetical protein DAPPUDRAFT_303681 [Daphnia pulex]|eukprot:EFX80994.1 hypothetical protein DAPPUDRAFT_303681 [Daphnia pulex]